MKVYLAFMKKEFMENFRNKKIIILAVVFLLIGMMSPVTAKLTPLIIKSVSMNGIEIKVPDPVEMDAWVQFFKNVGQMGMFVLALLLSNQMSNELQKGTLINLFSKGLSRYKVVIAKFSIGLIMWLVSYGLAFLVSWAYAVYFFGNTIDLSKILSAVAMPFIFGLLLISLELLGGIITGSVVGSLSFAGVFTVIQLILSIKSSISKYLPIYLVNNPLDILNGTKVSEFYPSIAITLVLTIVALWSSVVIMNKKQLS